jgi:hypothetical protein
MTINNCQHEVLTVKISYHRNYIVRLENGQATSVSLDLEEERCDSVACCRCGYRAFMPPTPSGGIKAPKFTKTIADFERQVSQIIDSDAFINELRGGPDDADYEE